MHSNKPGERISKSVYTNYSGRNLSRTPNKAGRTNFLTERRYKWAVGYA